MLRLLLLTLLLAPAAPSETITGKVVGVTDGNTLTVLDASETQYKIRLEGIDAPESNQTYGQRAKQTLSAKTFGQQVKVTWSERDRYERILGHVFVGDWHINKEMVEEGFAWHYTKYSSDEDLADAEVEARSNKSGLWSDSEPVVPWDFRNPAPAKFLSEEAALAESVYVTRTGEKYHRGSCRHLSKSKIPISLEDAKKRYSPCKVCRPPG